MKIMESIVYVYSQLIIFGRREIVQGGVLAEVSSSFGKILGKFWEFKTSPKPQHSMQSINLQDCYISAPFFPKSTNPVYGEGSVAALSCLSLVSFVLKPRPITAILRLVARPQVQI